MIALVKIKNQEADEAKDTLDEVKTQLEGVTGIDSTVYAAFYHASLDYYKAKSLALEFYRNGLLYLAYANLDTIPEQEKVSLAFDLSLAALIGESIYNFQELVCCFSSLC